MNQFKLLVLEVYAKCNGNLDDEFVDELTGEYIEKLSVPTVKKLIRQYGRIPFSDGELNTSYLKTLVYDEVLLCSNNTMQTN